MPPGQLPQWHEHPGEAKTGALVRPVPPSPYVRDFLQRTLARRQTPSSALRVLDVGCGRGDAVAWLLEQGWDAYGVDVADRYLHLGREYLRREGRSPDRLRLAEPDGTYPFDDGTFDVVISDQVIEHVADLETYVREIARVSAPGSTGHFACPARWRPLEAHLRAPLVHWLPKGRARRAAISAALRAGMAAPYFEDHPFDVRVEVFTRYSEEETYYRSLGTVLRTFRRHGFLTDAAASARDKVAFYRPQWPSPVVGLVAVAYRHLHSVVLETHRPG